MKYERLTISDLDSGFVDDDLILRQAYNRLAYFEDKLESGRLILLNCSIGDTYYYISKWKMREDKEWTYELKEATVENLEHCIDISDFIGMGECWLDKAKAETKLKELRGDAQ